LCAAEDFLQIFVQLILLGVIERVSRQSGEGLRFNPVDEFLRLALRGNEVIPAARAHSIGQLQNVLRDGISAAKIVEEPAIKFGGAQVVLNSLNVCRHGIQNVLRAAKLDGWLFYD